VAGDNLDRAEPYPALPAGTRVLVTGGGGFVGANLVRRLLQADCQVTIYDNFSAGRFGYLDGLPVQIVEGDILDNESMVKIVREQDGVVHLAANSGVPQSLLEPRLDFEANALGTLNVLEACRACLPGRAIKFVMASSSAPLGRQKPPIREDIAPLPISPYGASKLAAEGYCLAYHGSWGLPTIALRFSNAYGPFSGHKTSVVAVYFRNILSGQTLAVEGGGNQTRDFIYVDDICRAIEAALGSDVSGEIFQIATGRETSISELGAVISETAGQDARLSRAPARKGDVERSFSSIDKAAKMLKWSPRTELRDGLKLTWQWFKDAETRNSSASPRARPEAATALTGGQSVSDS
jgi:UDP-glucose 4-epimerase